jgi:PAS domain S-box-containing protein
MARSLTLRAKFNGIVIIVFLVLAAANAIDDYRRQQALAIRGAVDHAQILAHQIVQSREYLSRVTHDEPERNPNLIPQVAATSIAKMMSEGSNFHVRQISLRYRNPANRPDAYETSQLQGFKTSAPKETYQVIDGKEGALFRYLMPMRAEQSCLRCHGSYDEAPDFIKARFPRGHISYNYKVGEVIGAVSVSIPMAELYQQIGVNLKYDLIFSSLILFLIVMAMQFLIRRTVIDPISMLSESIDTVTRTGSFAERLPQRSKDEVGRLIGAFNDMMEELGRKTVQQQSSDERYRSFIEMAQSAVVTFLGDGKIVIANKQAEKLLGRSRQALLGESIFTFLENGERFRQEIERYMRDSGRGMESSIQRVTGPAGTATEVEIVLSASTADGIPLFTAILREHPHGRS